MIAPTHNKNNAVAISIRGIAKIIITTHIKNVPTVIVVLPVGNFVIYYHFVEDFVHCNIRGADAR